MAKILVTGFDPFGGERTNPSLEAVRLVPDSVLGAKVVRLAVPTSFSRSFPVVEEAVRAERPDLVVCVGQAGGRSAITVERVAINLADARIADNDGERPEEAEVVQDAPAAYFSTLPVKAMVGRMREGGIPAFASCSAGTFVCNALLYRVLRLLEEEGRGALGGFVHVPYVPEQATDKPEGTPTMPLETIARGLTLALEAAVEGAQAR